MVNKPIWNKTSAVTIGGWAGLWNNVFGSQYSQLDSQNVRRGLRLAMNEQGRLSYNATMAALLGAAVGGAISATRKRRSVQVVSPPGVIVSNFGDIKIVPETQTLLSRNSTAADRTAMLQDLTFASGMNAWGAGASFPVDKSGNGGGSKLGY